jgi:hypothetical protein
MNSREQCHSLGKQRDSEWIRTLVRNSAVTQSERHGRFTEDANGRVTDRLSVFREKPREKSHVTQVAVSKLQRLPGELATVSSREAFWALGKVTNGPKGLEIVSVGPQGKLRYDTVLRSTVRVETRKET